LGRRKSDRTPCAPPFSPLATSLCGLEEYDLRWSSPAGDLVTTLGRQILKLNGLGSPYSQLKWKFSIKTTPLKTLKIFEPNSQAKMAPDNGIRSRRIRAKNGLGCQVWAATPPRRSKGAPPIAHAPQRPAWRSCLAPLPGEAPTASLREAHRRASASTHQSVPRPHAPACPSSAPWPLAARSQPAKVHGTTRSPSSWFAFCSRLRRQAFT
jgi:hypothetical protein